MDEILYVKTEVWIYYESFNLLNSRLYFLCEIALNLRLSILEKLTAYSFKQARMKEKR